MADPQDPRKEQYERARRAFEELKIEDKAFFLVQEAISTVAQGIETAGRALADEFEALFRRAENGEQEAEAPKTEKKKTRSKTGKASAKKPRAKKTPPKKSAGKGGAAA